MPRQKVINFLTRLGKSIRRLKASGINMCKKCKKEKAVARMLTMHYITSQEAKKRAGLSRFSPITKEKKKKE